MQIYLRKYGTSTAIDFDLYDSNGANILTSAAFASGCCILSNENGISAFSTNLPTIVSNSFRLSFTSLELSNKSLKIKLVDTNINKSWLDKGILVETYGSSASFHENLATGLLDNLIDGIPLRDLFIEVIAQLTGEFIRNGDAFTYLRRDLSTTSHILSAGQNSRIRLD